MPSTYGEHRQNLPKNVRDKIATVAQKVQSKAFPAKTLQTLFECGAAIALAAINHSSAKDNVIEPLYKWMELEHD